MKHIPLIVSDRFFFSWGRNFFPPKYESVQTKNHFLTRFTGQFVFILKIPGNNKQIKRRYEPFLINDVRRGFKRNSSTDKSSPTMYSPDSKI